MSPMVDYLHFRRRRMMRITIACIALALIVGAIAYGWLQWYESRPDYKQDSLNQLKANLSALEKELAQRQSLFEQTTQNYETEISTLEKEKKERFWSELVLQKKNYRQKIIKLVTDLQNSRTEINYCLAQIEDAQRLLTILQDYNTTPVLTKSEQLLRSKIPLTGVLELK